MAIRIPKPAPPPAPDPVAPTLTRAEVQAMLAERDAEWAGKLADLQIALLSAIAASKPVPRKGAKITFETDHRGVITHANITPKE